MITSFLLYEQNLAKKGKRGIKILNNIFKRQHQKQQYRRLHM